MIGEFPKKPVIRKLGTIQSDIVETTPVVFGDRLYRFEVIRSFAKPPEAGGGRVPCLRFVDVRTNIPTPVFAENHTFGFPFTEDGVMYVVTGAGTEWGSETLHFFRSRDLKSWELYSEFTLPGWKIYNMNIAKMGCEYTLLLEIGAPAEECGANPFTFRFARSADMCSWELTPHECAFQRDRYSGGPALYAFDEDGYYYVGYLEAYPNECYANCLARSRNLTDWEYSPVNPVLMFDEYEDKKIGSPFIPPEERKRIAAALDVNNSDMELCEFLGRTIIYYSWGDQKGHEFLAEACYEGGMYDFLTGFFEYKAR